MTKPILTLSLLSIYTVTAGTVAISGGKSPGKSPSTPPAAESPWNVSAAGGLGLTKGNTDTLGASAHFLASYVTADEEFTFNADYFYGESDSVVNQNRVAVGAAYNRNLSSSLYLGIGSGFHHNEITELDYRLGVGPVLGYRLINSDSTKLAIEAGLGYTFEKQGGIKSDYVTFNAAQRFSHTLAGGSKITQGVSFSAEAEDFENFLATADISLEVPFSAHWAFKATVGTVYDNTPTAGQDENDLFALAGLSYSAQGFAPAAPGARPTLFTKRAAAAAQKEGWTNIGGVGFSLTNGNSDTLLGTVSYDAAFRGASHEIFYGLGGAYGEVGDSVNAQNARASAQYNKLLSDTTYVGASASLLHDDVAGVDYRFTPAAVLGAYLVKSDTAKISVEAGPSYVFEETTSGTAEYFALFAAQKASIALSDSVSLTQSLVYVPEVEDFGSYNLTAALALDFYFTDYLALRAAVSNTYDSTPSAGRDENDLVLSTGIAVQF
jgi:putative salt-induced outer membrane protein